MIRISSFLRWVLLADAATCIATGVLLMIGASTLHEFLGLPAELLRYAGVSLLPFAAWLVYLAMRESFSQSMIWAVIILNALWTIDSIFLLLSGWVAPTEVGYVFVIIQSVAVAMFAGLEYFGLRKSITTVI